tara:strand:+ start:4312 stop:5400 length:1089 start_codon:yes stop_codon:yes gene_type:complete
MLYSVAISQIKFLPKRIYTSIYSKNGCHKETYKEISHLVKNSNSKIAIKINTQIKNREPILRAEKIISDCQLLSIKIIDESSELYPNLLRECPDKPYVIYAKGDISANSQDLIAVVGTRNCSDYGLKNCDFFLKQLNQYKIGIVSGLAHGIDIQAHITANKLKIPNYAVLGSGINNIYPRLHQKIANDIIKNGMLISELPPNSPPFKFNFPKRNRIIAGMTKSTIIIESRENGGAMITAKLANDYNRDVFAIPGDINNSHYSGNNLLIYNHQAQLLYNPENILDFIDLQMAKNHESCKKKLNSKISGDEKLIYNFINKNRNSSFNKIQSNLNIPTQKLNYTLTKMEIDQLILQLPGKIYKLF